MIKSLKVTNHLGESITLELRSPEKSGFFIQSIEGLGPSKVHINTTNPLGLDGVVFNSSKVNYRNLVLDLGFYDTEATVETLRLLSYKYFPLKRPLEIVVETDSRIGKTVAFVESNEPNIFSKRSTTIISLLCPSAYFSAEAPITTLFSGVVSLFEFPFENPSLTESLIEFGELILDTRQTVLYEGDAETGVTIFIHLIGSASNINIYNITGSQTISIDSDKVIDITGSDFIAGDDIILSTVKGSKYIYLLRDGVLYNILNAIGSSAEWFIIDNGDNVFAFTADTGESNIQMYIQHYPLYEGL